MSSPVREVTSESTYLPILTEIDGLRDLITGVVQRALGNFEESAFGQAHPHEHRVIRLQEDAQQRIEEGKQKLAPAAKMAAAVGLLALGFAAGYMQHCV